MLLFLLISLMPLSMPLLLSFLFFQLSSFFWRRYWLRFADSHAAAIFFSLFFRCFRHSAPCRCHCFAFLSFSLLLPLIAALLSLSPALLARLLRCCAAADFDAIRFRYIFLRYFLLMMLMLRPCWCCHFSFFFFSPCQMLIWLFRHMIFHADIYFHFLCHMHMLCRFRFDAMPLISLMPLLFIFMLSRRAAIAAWCRLPLHYSLWRFWCRHTIDYFHYWLITFISLHYLLWLFHIAPFIDATLMISFFHFAILLSLMLMPLLRDAMLFSMLWCWLPCFSDDASALFWCWWSLLFIILLRH